MSNLRKPPKFLKPPLKNPEWPPEPPPPPEPPGYFSKVKPGTLPEEIKPINFSSFRVDPPLFTMPEWNKLFNKGKSKRKRKPETSYGVIEGGSGHLELFMLAWFIGFIMGATIVVFLGG